MSPVIRVNAIVLANGDEQAHFYVREPAGAPGARVSRLLQFDPEQEPYRRFSEVPAGERAALPDDLVRAVGEAVHNQLTAHPGVRHVLDGLVNAVDPDPVPIHIELTGGSAEAFPWEVLYHPQGEFLSLDDRWPIVRVAGSGTGTMSRLFQPPLRIAAVLAARDRDAMPEWEALRGAIRGSGFACRVLALVAQDDLHGHIQRQADPLVAVEYVPQDERALADRLLEARPNVLHLFCHGSSASPPYLEIATRASVTAGAEPVFASARTLSLLRDVTWVATVDACEGGAPAAALHSLIYGLVDKGMPAAVGMREAIDAQDANRFCGAFYRELLGLFRETLVPGATVVVPWARLLPRPRGALCPPPQQANAPRCKQWTLPVLYRRSEDLLVSMARPGVDEEAQARRFAELETLRQMREELHPAVPAQVRDGIDAAIEEIETALGLRE